MDLSYMDLFNLKGHCTAVYKLKLDNFCAFGITAFILLKSKISITGLFLVRQVNGQIIKRYYKRLINPNVA